MLGLLMCFNLALFAKENSSKERVVKKAWEFGFGASVYRLNRFSIIDFYQDKQKENFYLDTQKKDVLFGGNIYLAKELNSCLAIDLQGFVGFTRDKLKDGRDNRWILKPEIGMQWRLGNYLNSKYIDPYLRVGVAYLYKNFNIVYNGVEDFEGKEVVWSMNNLHNKQGADKRHMLGIPVGAGINMWLNSRFGIGMQCNYIIKPYKNVADDIEGTIRLMWRFGGESKESKPIVKYVEVERVVQVPVEVVKEVPIIEYIYDLLDNVYFDFDSSELLEASNEALDQIAFFMKQNSNRHFLIIGYTDAKGSASYNLRLSERRAKAVVDALVARGVTSTSLKYRGVGKSIAIAEPVSNNKIRKGDRKVGVEIITNQTYWDYIR